MEEEKISVSFVDGQIIADSNDATRDLFDKTRYGEPFNDNKFVYALVEGLFLMERGRFDISFGSAKKVLTFDQFVKKATKIESSFWTRYCVYRDLRKRGYIVKTALKFGADFRVYERGVKPGDDHAKWVVFPVPEASILTWQEFASKNRVAHSTKKKLLLGIVD